MTRSRTLLAMTVLLLGVAASTAADAPAFQAGVAVKVITPKEKIWLGGYGGRNKPAEGKVHDLHAKAIAIEDASGTRVVLITADLIGITRDISNYVTAALAKKTGLKREQVMLAISHSHCSPAIRGNLADMYPVTPEQSKQLDAYADQLQEDLIAVAVDALGKLKPAKLEVGQGEATFAMNRREPTDKGIINGKNLAGPVDHTVPVLKVTTIGAEKPLAVIFGYTCHNTTLQFYQYCGDYSGFAQANLEAAMPGTVAMYWTGCSADSNPQPRGKIELAQKHGKELADGVTKALTGPLTPVSGSLAARYAEIPLKYDTLPTKEKLQAESLSKTLAVQNRATRLLKQIAADGKLDDHYRHFPVQVWRLGDQVLWVSLGGEVVIDYAIRLRKDLKLPAGRTLWVTGYANDVMSYIPSARVLKEGGYEADSSMIYYGLPTRYLPEVEDAIVNKVLELSRSANGVK